MDPFKNLREELGRNIVRAWDRLSGGWRELLSRSGAALTHFANAAADKPESGAAVSLPAWSLLSADVWETAKSVIVRVEIPGMEKEGFDVSVHGGELRIRGEKLSGRDSQEREYSVMERAFGHFERRIALPHSIDSEQAEVSYQGGVLTVILPKTEDVPPQRLDIQ